MSTAPIDEAPSEASSAIRIALLQQLVKRVTVSATQLQVVVRLDAIGANTHRPASSDNNQSARGKFASRTTVITLPMELKRYGLGLRLIVHATRAQSAGRPDPRLVALLTRENNWFAQLIDGEHNSILTIAQHEGVSSSYIARVINLAFLAPEIASAIAQGQHPPTLTACSLLRRVPLPINWSDQRGRLGSVPQVTRSG